MTTRATRSLTRQSFRALRGLGSAEIPTKLTILYLRMPQGFAVRYWRRVMASPRGERWFAAHSRAAVQEMTLLADQLQAAVHLTGHPALELDTLLSRQMRQQPGGGRPGPADPWTRVDNGFDHRGAAVEARRAIIIDAITTGEAPGKLVRLPNVDGAFATDITPHELGLGLADLLAAARLSGPWPDELVLHGAQPGSTEFGTEVTPPVAAALDELLDAVEAELSGWGLARTPEHAQMHAWPALTGGPRDDD